MDLFDAPASGNEHVGVPITAGELADPACWNMDVGVPITTGGLADPTCWYHRWHPEIGQLTSCYVL